MFLRKGKVKATSTSSRYQVISARSGMFTCMRVFVMGAGHTYIEMHVRYFCCHLLVSELFSLPLWFEDQSTFKYPGGLHEETACYKGYCNTSRSTV